MPLPTLLLLFVGLSWCRVECLEPFPYSGFYVVNETTRASLFYVLSPAKNANVSTSPLVLWLQGGPGFASTGMGMLLENGPYILTDDLKLIPNEFGWNDQFSMLWLDQPAGSGWSFVEDESGYSHTSEEAAEQSHSALVQFFEEHNEFAGVDFYISGESYGGHWVPSLSAKIIREGKIPNFRGAIVMSGWVDPEIQSQAYAAQGHYYGLFDDLTTLEFEELQLSLLSSIKSGNYIKAFEIWNYTLLQRFGEVTGGVSPYDVRSHKPLPIGNVGKFMDQEWVRKMFRIPANVQHFETWNRTVYRNFGADFCRSMAEDLVEVLDSDQTYRVLLAVGQFDYCVAPSGVDPYVRALQWHGKDAFNALKRIPWWNSKGDLAGWHKSYANLAYFVVADSGHVIAMDQRANAKDLMDKFVLGG